MNKVVGAISEAIGEASGLKPGDDLITLGLMVGAKAKATTYCISVLESTTPEVRHMFATHLQDTLAGHERISKLAVARGYYNAHAAPPELLAQAVHQAQPAIQ